MGLLLIKSLFTGSSAVSFSPVFCLDCSSISGITLVVSLLLRVFEDFFDFAETSFSPKSKNFNAFLVGFTTLLVLRTGALFSTCFLFLVSFLLISTLISLNALFRFFLLLLLVCTGVLGISFSLLQFSVSLSLSQGAAASVDFLLAFFKFSLVAELLVFSSFA